MKLNIRVKHYLLSIMEDGTLRKINFYFLSYPMIQQHKDEAKQALRCTAYSAIPVGIEGQALIDKLNEFGTIGIKSDVLTRNVHTSLDDGKLYLCLDSCKTGHSFKSHYDMKNNVIVEQDDVYIDYDPIRKRWEHISQNIPIERKTIEVKKVEPVIKQSMVEERPESKLSTIDTEQYDQPDVLAKPIERHEIVIPERDYYMIDSSIKGLQIRDNVGTANLVMECGFIAFCNALNLIPEAEITLNKNAKIKAILLKGKGLSNDDFKILSKTYNVNILLISSSDHDVTKDTWHYTCEKFITNLSGKAIVLYNTIGSGDLGHYTHCVDERAYDLFNECDLKSDYMNDLVFDLVQERYQNWVSLWNNLNFKNGTSKIYLTNANLNKKDLIFKSGNSLIYNNNQSIYISNKLFTVNNSKQIYIHLKNLMINDKENNMKIDLINGVIVVSV